MYYPDEVLLRKLETYHEDYIYYKGTWEEIAELRLGAPAVLRDPGKYIKRKPGEDLDVYKNRLEKTSYTPVFSEAVKSFVTNLEDAPLHLDVEDSDEEFWNTFRNAVDGDEKKDRDWLLSVFSSLLYFGRHAIGVDMAEVPVSPRSLLEGEQLEAMPYLVDFEPLQVIDFKKKKWYKTREIRFISDPLDGSQPYLCYTLWGEHETAEYAAEVELSNQLSTVKLLEGQEPFKLGVGSMQIGIYEVIRVRDTDGNWLSPSSPDVKLRKTKSLVHGLGRPMMSYLELPQELWTGKDIAPKQIQHMRIESSWTYSGVMAGIVVPIFTPSPPAPKDDTRHIYEAPNEHNVKPDGSHVMIGQGFQFVESPGLAITNLTLQLDKIASQIEKLVNLQFATSNQSKGLLEQSGAAKEIDRGLQKKTLQTYGTHILSLYQNALNIIADLRRKKRATATGLDKFESATLDTMLDQSGKLVVMNPPLPPTAMRIWYGKLIDLVVGEVSDEDREQIEDELMELFSEEEDIDLNDPEVLSQVAETLGVLPEELTSILGDE